MSDSLRPHGLYSPWNFPGQSTGVGSLSLLQGIFPAQGWNPGLLHCKRMRILHQLSHQGSPMERVLPRKQTTLGHWRALQPSPLRRIKVLTPAPSVWPGSPPPRAVLRSMLLLAPLMTTISPVCRTAISFTTMPREIARRRLSSPPRPLGPGVGQCVVCSAVSLCACAFRTAPPPSPMGLSAWMPLDSAVPGGHAARMRFPHGPAPISHGSQRLDTPRISCAWRSRCAHALSAHFPSPPPPTVLRVWMALD